MAHLHQEAVDGPVRPIECTARSQAGAAQAHADRPGMLAQSGGAQAQGGQACESDLKSTVYEPFMLVVRTAQSLGLEAALGLAAHEAQKHGLPQVEVTLATLKKALLALPSSTALHLSLLDQLVQTQAAVASASGQAGMPSDYRGVERRGFAMPAAGDPARARIEP